MITRRLIRCRGHQLLGGFALACLAWAGTVPAVAQESAQTLSAAEAIPRIDKLGKGDIETWLTPPRALSTRLFRESPDCVRAKLDVWFHEGRYTSTLFTPGTRVVRPDLSKIDVTEEGKTTFIIGPEGCRYRVQIDKAE